VGQRIENQIGNVPVCQGTKDMDPLPATNDQ